jgi:hypothetical protein
MTRRGAPSSKSPAYSILKGPPTKQIIAARIARICGKEASEKLANVPRIGTITAPERNNSPPCLTPLRRGDAGTGSSGVDRYTGTIPPVPSNWITPSNGKPQREQYLTIPEACC